MRRRAAALLALACVTAAGCGAGSEPGERVAALESWQLPPDVFIPQVDAPTEPTAAQRAEQRRARERAERRARQRAERRAREKPEAPPASEISPGAPSDDEVRAQLEELYGSGAGGGDLGGGDGAGQDGGLTRVVTLDRGQAFAPPDAPAAVQRIVAAANQVARLPYVYGGGHGRAHGLFVDTAYDCSGSISFAMANAGLMDRPMTSGEMMRWGRPGKGKWVTIYANPEHAFMVVGGARFDTVGLRETGSRWQQPFRSIRGFVARHPPGL